MPDPADCSLVLKLQKRERAAWAQAYEMHAGDVFVFLAHLLHGDKAAAEEIHQETWLAALAGIDAFDVKRGELRAWIFGIARRKVALYFRRRAGVRDEAGDGGQIAAAIDHGTILPDDLLGAVERNDAVRAALAALGADARGALVAKYVDGQSVQEVAQRLGRTPKAVESLLSRARARMRGLLRRYFDTEEEVTKVVEP
jgi:RNA polymerase sigma-70 factor (ECF subfamily)